MARLRRVQDRRTAVENAMNLVHIDDRADDRIAKLSKGYRQRVGLAQALLHDPPVLILDEPTVGLDPRQITEVRQLIKGFGREHTVILSTHILPEVSMICSRVLIVNDGQVVAEDTPENLTRRLRGADNLQLEVRGPRREVLTSLKKVPRVLNVEATDGRDGRTVFTVACEVGSDVREQLAAAIVGGGWGLLELRPVGMSLEEIFLKLTTTEEAA
jgi:ABC-2 type transport system ATP-binding protein